MKLRKARQSAEIFGLGNAITDGDAIIKGGQVLRCLMYQT